MNVFEFSCVIIMLVPNHPQLQDQLKRVLKATAMFRREARSLSCALYMNSAISKRNEFNLETLSDE